MAGQLLAALGVLVLFGSLFITAIQGIQIAIIGVGFIALSIYLSVR